MCVYIYYSSGIALIVFMVEIIRLILQVSMKATSVREKKLFIIEMHEHKH